MLRHSGTDPADETKSEWIVVAPDGPRSGQSNAITVHTSCAIPVCLKAATDWPSIRATALYRLRKLAFNDIIDQNPIWLLRA